MQLKKTSAGIVLAVIGAALAWRMYSNTSRNIGALEVLSADVSLARALLMNTPASTMRTSAAGIDAIAKREGFAARKYVDASGFSIGYGHYIKVGESFTEPMTEQTARKLLQADVVTAENAVRGSVTVSLSQNAFDALVSFVYNVGVGAFKSSTLLKRLNAGDYAGAAVQFDVWHKPALVIARRDGEKKQFMA